MKIAILGGTFNPVHIAHINIAKTLRKKHGFDEVWLVPSHRTPQKNFFPEKITGEQRLAMINEAIKEYGFEKWLRVKDFEIKNKNISFSFETIKYFIENNPNDKFVFVMGDDQYKYFDTWKNAKKIRELVEIYVFKRIGLPNFIIGKNVTYIEDIVYQVSSSMILRELKWDLIPYSVKKYIAKNHLYLKAAVFYKLHDSKRFEHSLSVASHARRLAKKYNYYNPNNAYIAGLVHDMFKNEKDADLLKYVSVNSNWKIPPAPALHGYKSALWLEKEYLLENKDIISAVKKHTIPDDNMNLLDKIVYVADKISADRDNKLASHMKKLAYLNLDETFKKLLKVQYQKLLLSGEEIDPVTLKAYNTYVLGIESKSYKKKEIKKEKKKNDKFIKLN